MPADVVLDPALTRLLRRYEAARPDDAKVVLRAARPDDAKVLLRCLEAAASWFAAHPGVDAPRSVIHGDFVPWNLLFDDGRLTGVVDFEGAHHTFQVADFTLSWRGYQDDVLVGYDEVRSLSDVEWQLVRPVHWAWLFMGVKQLLAGYYDGPGRAGSPPDLGWWVTHVRRQSDLVLRKAGPDG